MTYREPTGEARWANTDPSLHFNHDTPRPTIDWRRVYNYCLKMYDYDAAELVMKLNLVSDECHFQDHGLCHLSWCGCVCHSAIRFELEHPPLRSLSEVEAALEAEKEVQSV